jgi:hypothetical protein
MTVKPLRGGPATPSPLRERAGVRVKVADISPPHLTSPPQRGEEYLVIGRPP